MITIEFDGARVLSALNRLLQAVADPKPAYRDIGEYLVRSTKQRGGAGRYALGGPITRYHRTQRSRHAPGWGVKTAALGDPLPGDKRWR
jgi:hypothetical protein